MKTKTDKFPLWLHPCGQWTKKHLGRFHYFGTDKDAALVRYVAEWPDIKSGRPRQPASGQSVTLGRLVNAFLTAKRHRVESGELTARQWGEYHATCDQLVTAFGKNCEVSGLTPNDFGGLRAKAAKRLGPFALSKFVQMVRTVFHYGYDDGAGMLPVPVKYGGQFDKPPKRVMRLARKAKAARLLAPEDVRRMLNKASPQLKAMVLLGLNCGFGQKDCADLQQNHLTVRPGWLSVVRQKTGIDRRCDLWPETVRALEDARVARPEPAAEAEAGCVFLTRFGRRWVRYEPGEDGGAGVPMDALMPEFKKLGKAAGVKVPGGFLVLRHTFRTVADAVKDQVAVGVIMGHVDASVADVYREGIDDDRIRAVTDHVREWLFGGKKGAGQAC